MGLAVSVTVDQVLEIAEECVFMPFAHQGRQPDPGFDCVGLVRYPGVLLQTISPNMDYPGYPASPQRAVFQRVLNKHLVKREGDPVPSDILFLDFKGNLHLALLGYRNRMIHAVGEKLKTGWSGNVVCNDFVTPWPGRLIHVYKYPGVND